MKNTWYNIVSLWILAVFSLAHISSIQKLKPDMYLYLWMKNINILKLFMVIKINNKKITYKVIVVIKDIQFDYTSL